MSKPNESEKQDDVHLTVIQARDPHDFQITVNVFLREGGWRVVQTEMSVTDSHYAAKRLKDSIESAKKTYQEYVSLAGGDTDKARVFFDKAFKDKLSDEVYFSVFPREVAA